MYRSASLPSLAPRTMHPVFAFAAMACWGTTLAVVALHVQGFLPLPFFEGPILLAGIAPANLFLPLWLVYLHRAVARPAKARVRPTAMVIGAAAWFAAVEVAGVAFGASEYAGPVAALITVVRVGTGSAIAIDALVRLRRTEPWERWLPVAVAGAFIAQSSGGQFISSLLSDGTVLAALSMGSLAQLLAIGEHRAHPMRTVALVATWVAAMVPSVPPLELIALLVFAVGFARSLPSVPNRAATAMGWLAFLLFAEPVLAATLDLVTMPLQQSRPYGAYHAAMPFLVVASGGAALLASHAQDAEAKRRGGVLLVVVGAIAVHAVVYFAVAAQPPPLFTLRFAYDPFDMAGLSVALVAIAATVIAWLVVFRPQRPVTPAVDPIARLSGDPRATA